MNKKIIFPANYNTIEGIKASMSSYETFIKMLNDRHEAGYVRREHLEEFIILGRFELDSCGNTNKIIKDFIPAEHIPELELVVEKYSFYNLIKKWQKKIQPDVLTEEEIHNPNFDYSKNTRPYPISITTSLGNNCIPPIGIICPVCKKGWEVRTCYDSVVTHEKCDSAKAEVGKTVKDIKEELNKKTDARYFIRDFITNEKYVDLTPKDDYPTLSKNEGGYLDIEKDYIFAEGDYFYFDTHYYYHKECLIAKAENDCKEYLKNNGEGYFQGNLAGRIDCNPYVELELKLAGIDVIIKDKITGEVPTIYKGKLNGFDFERAWYYWMVEGLVPLNLAKQMYKDPIGEKAIRVAGHCGCPAPDQWSTEIKGKQYITHYHIDSWQGLKLFADTCGNIK